MSTNSVISQFIFTAKASFICWELGFMIMWPWWFPATWSKRSQSRTAIGSFSLAAGNCAGGHALSAQLYLLYCMQICGHFVPRPTRWKAAYLRVAGAKRLKQGLLSFWIQSARYKKINKRLYNTKSTKDWDPYQNVSKDKTYLRLPERWQYSLHSPATCPHRWDK